MHSRVVERFLKYVQTSSESGSERNFCLLMEEELKRLGFAVDRDECGHRIDSDGFNIHAFLAGSSSEEPLLFCCHMDTVAPGKDIKPGICDGVIRSDGTTVLGGDDKAGIAAVLEGAERLIEKNALGRSVEILFTLSEETGLRGSGAADYSLIRSRQAIVFDSGGRIGEVINRSPEMINLSVEVLGKAAHAANSANEGIHALKAAAKAVNDIRTGYVDEISEVNVGNFLAPGKTNVICPRATFDLEIRSFEKEHALQLKEQICEVIRAACEQFGAGCEIVETHHAQAIFVEPQSALLKMVGDAFAKSGVCLEAHSTFGGCDASNLAAHGISALNVSCGMDKVHSTEECLKVADLEATANFVEGILAK